MTEQEFLDAFANLPPLTNLDENDPWGRHRQGIRRSVINDSLEKFTSWPTIVATMYVSSTRRLMKKKRELMQNFDRHRFHQAVHPTKFEEFPTNAINQLYHLYQWESYSSLRIDELDTIVEFGGGYGAMCAMIRRLGFLGEYHIYDLPELSLLQQYYLSQIDCPDGDRNVFTWVENERFAVPPGNVNLLIGCCSLSEVNPRLREAFFNAVHPQHCLILHQSIFMKENLPEYFSHFIKKQDEYAWFQKGHPHNKEAYYLIGSKIND